MSSKKNGRIYRTVKFRLVLWYATLFTVVSVAAFFLVYVTLNYSFQNIIDESLRSMFKDVEDHYRSEGSVGLHNAIAEKAKNIGEDRVFFRLLSSRKEVLDASDMSAWRWINFQSVAPGPVSKGRNDYYQTLSMPDRPYSVRVISRWLDDSRFLQIGHTLEEDEKFIEQYRQISGIAVAVSLLCGVLTGWFVARRAMSGVERVTETAVRIQSGDLTHRVPLRNEGQEIDNLALAFNDMLERIQALVTGLKEVTSNIAHDLRSPITRIRGMAETTLTGEESLEDYRETAGMIIEESDRLVGIINTMLEIAATDSGATHFQMDEVDVADVVQEAYELFEPVAEDSGVSLSVDCPDGAILVRGDIRRLQRVFATLLDNAIKYTLPGGTVLISAKHNQDKVSISVVDSGVGISKDELPHIFERFYRSDRSRSTPGSGLGLSLARSFVQAHGGEITVASTPGQGSTFTVLLPILT